MAGFELNTKSFDDVTRSAEELDKNILKIIDHSRELNEKLANISKNPLVLNVNTELFSRLKQDFETLGKTKVSPNFDSSRAEQYYSIIDDIVNKMSTLSAGKVELFDPSKLYTTNESIIDLMAKSEALNAKIKEATDKYNQTEKPFESEKFERPRDEKGRFLGKNTEQYKAALAEHEAKMNLDRQEYEQKEALRVAYERRVAKLRLEELHNERKILDQKIIWANLTVAEQVKATQKRNDQLSKEEKKHIESIRKEYQKIINDELDITKKMGKLDKSGIGQEGDATRAVYEQQLQDRDKRRREIEQNYANFIVDIFEKANRQILDIEVRNIKERQAADEKARQEALEAYRKTSTGALDYAGKATTIDEYKQAQKYLLAARDSTNVKDTATIDALNKKYQELRITIEELTKAEKNEQTLQPTVRNEYARLLKELDKVQEARTKLEKSSAFQTNKKDAQTAYDDLVARETDIQRKIIDIRQAAQGQLDEIDRKHAAERALNEVREIEKAEARRAELTRQRNSKLGTISSDSANKLIDIASNAKNIKQDEEAIKRLKAARDNLDKTDAKYRRTLKSINDAIDRHKRSIDLATMSTSQLQAEQRKLAQQRLDAYWSGNAERAMRFSQLADTKSLKEQIRAINYLKQARSNLDKSTMGATQYEQTIKRINDEIRRQQTEVDKLTGKTKAAHTSLMNTTGRLQQTLTTIFSISAIKNYINKLVSIRGEFEMQHRSLQVLLQDKNEADKLWDKTVKLAVKSPLTTQQLVTYTKQLAAYRIEHDKLYETNKMLADVSQGLGVDMNRLILAYGQVKAANFLRGTELRQFSEAGVNLLDELAKRFTALEGRAVSVGDVFERVSKRMVSFKDVAAVFETITSEGGMFYQMQEKQSETLKGQIMNLKDSYLLMLNDIGQNNEKFLKWVVSLMRELINNWRSWSFLIVGVATAIQTHLVGKGIVKLVAGLKSATLGFKSLFIWATRSTAAMEAFKRKNKIASLSSPWIALATAIASVAAMIIYTSTQVSKLNAELSRIDTDLNRQLQESIDGYLSLAKAVTDVTKSTREQNEALAKLKSNYGEILKDRYVDIKYLKETKDGYTEATKAIKLYYEALAIDRKKEKVREEYEPKVDESVVELEKGLKYAIRNSTLSTGDKNMLQANVSAMVHQVLNDVNSGKIGSDLESIRNAIYEKMAFAVDIDAETLRESLVGGGGGRIYDDVDNLSEAIGTLNEKLNEVEGLNKELVPRSQVQGLRESQKQVEIATESFNQFKVALTNVANGSSSFNDVMKEIDSFQIPKGMTEYKQLLIDVRTMMIAAAKDGSVAFQREMPKIEKYFADGMNKIITKSNKGNDAVVNFGETIIEQAKNKSHQEWAKNVFDAMEKIADSYKSNTTVFKTIIPEAEQSLGDYQKIVKGKLEEYENLLKQYSTSTSTLLGKIMGAYMLSQYGFGSKEELETAIKMLEQLNKYVGNYDKSSSSKKTDDTYSRRIKLVEDMRKAYEDLNKTWGKTIALEKIQESFDKEAKELKVPIGDMDVSTIEGYIEALKSIESLVKKDAKAYKEWKKALREANLELEKTTKIEGFEKTKRELDKLFDKYELSVEIDKLNMPKDIAEGLFGAESIDLSGLRDRMNKETDNLLDDLAELRKMESKSDAESLKNNKEYQKLKAKINEKWSQEEIKLADETNKKLDELETKSIEDRLKKYTKYLEQSFSELGKVYVNGADQILEIEKTYKDALEKLAKDSGLTPNEVLGRPDGKALAEWRKKAIQGVQKETQESVDKQAWDAFKSSAMYEQLFSDIEHLGTVATDILIDRLKDLKDELKNLPPDVYKSIQQSIDKLEAHQIALNPFGAFKDNLKEVRKLEKTLYMDDKGDIYRGRDAISAELGDTQEDINQLVREIALLEAYEKSQKSINAMRKEGIDLTESEMMWLMSITDTTDEIAKKEAQLNILRERAAKLVVNMDVYAELSDSQKEAIAMTKRWGDEIGNLLGGVDSLLEAFGLAEDSQARIWLQMSMGIVESITQMAMLTIQAQALGTATNAALGVIGWIATALQAVATLLSAVFQAHDQNLQRQIDNLADGVRKLEKEFEALEKSIEKAFEIDSLKKDWDDAMTNINQRIADTAQMISLEQKKKSTDDDAIKDYEDQMAELEEQRKELYEETLESLGGVVDIRSATREFVDAWYDAFKETGNGLEGLKENFTDFFANVVAEQAVMTGAGKIMQPLFDEINKSLEGDFEVTAQEYANIDAKQAEQLKKLDTFLTEYYEKYGNILTSGDQLSGLQKGIQGITEEQADILAAYWSSVRFFVANIDTTLTNLAAHIFGQATATDNPMISQLKLIASNTTAINNLLSSVTKGSHPKGGQGIKVFIN